MLVPLVLKVALVLLFSLLSPHLGPLAAFLGGDHYRPNPTAVPATLLRDCRHGEISDLRLVIPVYNDRGLEAVKAQLGAHTMPGDIFLVVSGNFNTLNISWLNKTVAALKEIYPDNPVFVGTGGLQNAEKVIQGVTRPYDGVVYIYEPNLPCGHEFTWDCEKTAENFRQAAELAQRRGLPLIAKPTGRPLLQPGLQKFNWDYGELAAQVDMMFVQTQTYGKKGPDTFARAVDKLQAQFGARQTSASWFPVISIDPEAPNGIPVAQAGECARIAADGGVTGLVMWWSPRYADAAVEFLKLLGR